MSSRPSPLVHYNAYYYKYPNTITSGRYPIEAGLSYGDRVFRERWLARVTEQSRSEFHMVVDQTFASGGDYATLRSFLKQHGVFAERFFKREIRSQAAFRLGEAQIELQELERLLSLAWGGECRVYNESDAVSQIVDHIYEHTLLHAVSERGIQRRLEEWFEKSKETRSCGLCGNQFRLVDLPDWMYFGSNGYGYCCFQCQIVQRPLKSELARLIPEFTDLCGFIPNSDATPISWAFTCRLRENQWKEVMLAYARMGGIVHVKKKYGSWFRGLAQSGALPNGVLATARGIRCLARDGHMCHSLDEQLIDDWLSTNGISHEREPLYPAHPSLNPSGRRRADWKVQGAFIEYFGLAGEPRYDEKTDEKIALAQHCGIDLITLYPSDLANLADKLGHPADEGSHLTP